MHIEKLRAHRRRLKKALAKQDRAGYMKFEAVVYLDVELPKNERDKRNVFTAYGIDTCDCFFKIALAANTKPRYGGDGVNCYFFADLERRVEGFFSLLRHDDGSTTVAVFEDRSCIERAETADDE